MHASSLFLHGFAERAAASYDARPFMPLRRALFVVHKERPVAWLILVLAGIFEVGWAVSLKASDGFSRFWPSAATAVSMLTSVLLLGVALERLPLGTAYAVWTGIGAIGAAAFGIILFGEAVTPARLVSIALILAGIAGLRLTASANAELPAKEIRQTAEPD
jgi:quaternary ammonium compound-resistance protein SugE